MVDPDSQLRVAHSQRTGRFQQNVGELVRGVPALGSLAANGHRLVMGESLAALGHGRRHLGLGALHRVQPEALEQLLRGFRRDAAFFDILLVRGIEILIHPAGVDLSSDQLLKAREQLGEPL